MRPAVLLLAAAVLAGCASHPPMPEPTPGSAVLVIRFLGLGSDAGELAYAIYGDERSFDVGDEPVAAGTLAIRGGVAEGTMRLPRGVYAVKAYHDLNGNGRLERGAFGRPTEPYGFSNDARGNFGAPSWKAARFTLDAPRQRVEIRLR